MDHVSALQVRMDESSARLGGLIVEFQKLFLVNRELYSLFVKYSVPAFNRSDLQGRAGKTLKAKKLET